jgi:ribonuclease-3
MSDRLSVFQARIGYQFQKVELLERALTHPSHGDGRSRLQSYERLEFLGDRVLGLMAASYLLEAFEGIDEGGLAQRLNALVNKNACARAAERCQLGPALILSPAEDRLGGREKPSILADACEAVIGALYLDDGLPTAQKFFDQFWAEELDGLTRRPKDPKSGLQEWAASKRYGQPVYELIGQTGPDHRPVFQVEVHVEGLKSAKGEGGSKQEAQRHAAEALLHREGASLG